MLDRFFYNIIIVGYKWHTHQMLRAISFKPKLSISKLVVSYCWSLSWHIILNDTSMDILELDIIQYECDFWFGCRILSISIGQDRTHLNEVLFTNSTIQLQQASHEKWEKTSNVDAINHYSLMCHQSELFWEIAVIIYNNQYVDASNSGS